MKICALLILITLATLSSAAISNYRGHNNNHFGGKSYTPTARTQTKSYTHSGSSNDKDVKILRNDQEMKKDGSYNYAYETSNGISGQEHGMGGVAVQGASSYISPEGVEIKLSYTADETGYHPVGDHIPKIPDYILRSLEYIKTHPYKVKTADSRSSAAAPKYTPHPISTNIAPPTYKPAVSRRLTPAPTPSKYKAIPYSRQNVASRNTKNQYRGNTRRSKY